MTVYLRLTTHFRHKAANFLCLTADRQLSLSPARDKSYFIPQSAWVFPGGCVLSVHDDSNHGTVGRLRMWRTEVHGTR